MASPPRPKLLQETLFWEPGRTVQDVLGWENRYVAPFLHVLPLNDVRTHTTGCGCWCSPRYEEEPSPHGGLICMVVHASADDREAYERGERQKN
jgi:hypothetical protein